MGLSTVEVASTWSATTKGLESLQVEITFLKPHHHILHTSQKSRYRITYPSKWTLEDLGSTRKH